MTIHPSRWALAALSLAAITFAGRSARADAPGLFGLGARSAGLARAVVAAGDPVDAPRENPAAAAAPGLRLRLGYGYGALGLRFDGADAGVERASGVHLAAQYGRAAGPVDVGLALALHFPDQYLAKIGFRPASEPQFVLYESSLQRVTFDLVAAVRWRWLSIGGGISAGLTVGGQGTRFDLAQDAHGAGADAAIDDALPYRLAPIVGARADLGRVAIAAAFRGPMALDLRLHSFNTVALQDNPLNGTTTVRVSGSSGYDPAVVTVGARARVVGGLFAMASIEYAVYRATPPPVAEVVIDVKLGTTPGQREARFVEPRFRDTLTPRVGLELGPSPAPVDASAPARRAPIRRWVARAGYAVAPSPVPAQIGFTTYADATRHEIAVGAGVHLGRLGGVDLTLDAAGQLHLLAPRSVQKQSLALPYARHTIGGEIVYGTATLEASW